MKKVDLELEVVKGRSKSLTRLLEEGVRGKGGLEQLASLETSGSLFEATAAPRPHSSRPTSTVPTAPSEDADIDLKPDEPTADV